MKKYLAIFAAATAALSLVSCNKEKFEQAQQPSASTSNIILNITVGNPDGPATKAVKAGWENGDQINLWFDNNLTATPDLVIVYDGTEWKNDETATVSGAVPSASGTLNAVYVQGGLAKMGSYSSTGSAATFSTGKSTTSVAGALLDNAAPLATVVEKADYTYESDVLTADLSAWDFKTVNNVQVVITSLPAGNWVLKCNHLQAATSFTLANGGFGASTASADAYALPTDNADGKAYMLRYDSADSDFLFTLNEVKSNVTLTFSATGKTLDKTGKLNAIKIDYSKFEDIYPSYVLVGDTEAYAFVNKTVAEKEIVRDITFRDCSIYPVRELKKRVKRVEGTLTIDNTSSTYIAMFELDESERSICIMNTTAEFNPAFCGEIKNKIVEGNLIFRNCPNTHLNYDDGMSPCAIKEVGGDFIIDGCKDINGTTFKNLTKVGGDLVITNNTRFWDLRQKTIALTEIGGNLVVKGNESLDSTIGFEHLTKIGGNVTFFGPYIPNQDADANIKGFKIFKTYLDNGVISPNATILIGRNEANPIDVNSL